MTIKRAYNVRSMLFGCMWFANSIGCTTPPADLGMDQAQNVPSVELLPSNTQPQELTYRPNGLIMGNEELHSTAREAEKNVATAIQKTVKPKPNIEELGMTHNTDIEAEAESTISALTMATQAEANTDGMDSDEEAEQQISRMQLYIASKRENMTEKVAEINDKEENKAALLASNGVILNNINEKNTDTDDTNRTLEQSILEIEEGSYITVNCIACRQPVHCTHNMLRTLLDRYNSVYTYRSAFSDKIRFGYPDIKFNPKAKEDFHLFIILMKFIQRNSQSDRKFDRCFRCMNQRDVEELQRTFDENTEEIARLE